jgi:hypothetical protein
MIISVSVEVDDPDCGLHIPLTLWIPRSHQWCAMHPLEQEWSNGNLVPLSAVDTVQQLTYRPNDTLPSVPLGNLIPSILHNPTTSFSPQVLTVGDVIVLNGSILNYTIVDAFDGLDANATPVSSFAYYNNPFSDGCDVVRACKFRKILHNSSCRRA